MAYRTVTFHIHEEDYLSGLTIKFLNAGEENLTPFHWNPKDGGEGGIAEVYPIHDDTKIVGRELYGGTKEQFEYENRQHARLLKRHGKKQGELVHMPKTFAHKAGLVRSNITDRR